MKKRAYSVIKVIQSVYITSSYDYVYELIVNWRGQRRWIVFEPDTGIVWAGKTKHGNSKSMIRKYPKYLRREMLTAVLELLQSDDVRFYEYDKFGNKRYENLRYHNAQSLEDEIDILKAEMLK